MDDNKEESITDNNDGVDASTILIMDENNTNTPKQQHQCSKVMMKMMTYKKVIK
jgi:hypothetical protein